MEWCFTVVLDVDFLNPSLMCKGFTMCLFCAGRKRLIVLSSLRHSLQPLRVGEQFAVLGCLLKIWCELKFLELCQHGVLCTLRIYLNKFTRLEYSKWVMYNRVKNANNEHNLRFFFVVQKHSQYPAYALLSGSAIPGGGIVVGTSSGTVYFIKSSLNEPLSLSTMDSVPGQVSKYLNPLNLW